MTASRSLVCPGGPGVVVMTTILSSESPSVSTSQSTVIGPTEGCSIVLWSSRCVATVPVAQVGEPPAGRAQVVDQPRQACVLREAAGGAAQVGHHGGVDGLPVQFGHGPEGEAGGARTESSRAKLRSRGGVGEGSPSRAAQPRFTRSAASPPNTATATSPSRESRRCTPGGMWSEIAPSAGRARRASDRPERQQRPADRYRGYGRHRRPGHREARLGLRPFRQPYG